MPVTSPAIPVLGDRPCSLPYPPQLAPAMPSRRRGWRAHSGERLAVRGNWRGRGSRRRCWPIPALVVRGGILPSPLLAASLAENVAAAQPTATGWVIAEWPSFAPIAVYELLMRQVRRSAAAGGTAQPRQSARQGGSRPRGQAHQAMGQAVKAMRDEICGGVRAVQLRTRAKSGLR
jgi:hypothetical protein